MLKDAMDREIVVGCYIAYAGFNDATNKFPVLKIGKVEKFTDSGCMRVRRVDEPSTTSGTLRHPDRCMVIPKEFVPEWMFRE